MTTIQTKLNFMKARAQISLAGPWLHQQGMASDILKLIEALEQAFTWIDPDANRINYEMAIEKILEGK